MESKSTPAQVSPGVLYLGEIEGLLSCTIIPGALIAAFVNMRGVQAR
jgi:hypothetical protein